MKRGILLACCLLALFHSMPTRADAGSAVRAALASGQPTLIEFGADTCGQCKRMKVVLDGVNRRVQGRAHGANLAESLKSGVLSDGTKSALGFPMQNFQLPSPPLPIPLPDGGECVMLRARAGEMFAESSLADSRYHCGGIAVGAARVALVPVDNTQAYNVCSQMPRLGHNSILTPEKTPISRLI